MTRFCFLLVFGVATHFSALHAEATYAQSLEAKELPVGNMLVWETVSEFDVSAFVVEKSTDGQSFFEVGTVPGSGFSMVDKSYRFMDVGPSTPKNYYRLKEVAADGTSNLSIPVIVEKKLVNDLQIVSASKMETNKIFKVTVDVLRKVDITCSLADMSGKKLESFVHPAPSGLTNIEVNLENRAPGTYQFVLQVGKEVETFTLRKVGAAPNTLPPVATTKKAGGENRQ